MALGARRFNFLMLIVKELAAICSLGIIGGIAISAAAGPTARSLLFRHETERSRNLGPPCRRRYIHCRIASLIRALCAAHVDPIVALHEEVKIR